MKVLNVPVTKLEKLVAEHDVNFVVVEPAPGESDGHWVEVGTEEYEAVKDWVVIGDWSWHRDSATKACTLTVAKLKREVDWSVNPVAVSTNGEAPGAADEALKELNRPVTALVFHRRILHAAGQEVRRPQVISFARAALENIRRALPDCQPGDLAVCVVDWERKNVVFESLPDDILGK